MPKMIHLFGRLVVNQGKIRKYENVSFCTLFKYNFVTNFMKIRLAVLQKNREVRMYGNGLIKLAFAAQGCYYP